MRRNYGTGSETTAVMSLPSSITIGQRIGRLVVLGRDRSVQKKNAYWLCQCDCGNFKSVSSPDLRRKHTKSCGCLARESKKWPSRAEMHRQNKLRYVQKNRLVLNAKQLTAYYADKEVWRRQEREARKRNPEKARAKGRHDEAKRRARLAQAEINDLTRSQWEEIKCAYGHRCVYCGEKPLRLTMDHITPLARGGNHTASNIVPACKSCNSSKGARAPLKAVQPLLLTVS